MSTTNLGKRPFLAVYDYGQGGLWCYISARSAVEITERYPQLRVVEAVPAWLTKEHSDKLERHDIDEAPSGWLATLGRALP